MEQKRYTVVAVTEAEHNKADRDPTYSPQEHVAGEILAASEAQALRKLRLGIKKGFFPVGSKLDL